MCVALWAHGIHAKALYVSNESGSDQTGDGTSANPYASISGAMSQAKAGDQILLEDGVYREKVLFAASNLTLSASGDSAVISGTDIVNNWIDLGNGLFKSYQPDTVHQVLLNSIPQVKAKFPNQVADTNLFVFTTTSIQKADSSITMDSLSDALGDLSGATIWYLVGHRWLASTAEVSSHNGTSLILNNMSTSWSGEGIAYLTNSLSLLDTSGEWHWQNDTLYFQFDEGDLNSHVIEAQVRKTLIDYNGNDGVMVDGVHGYSGNVLMTSSNDGILRNCSFRYLNQYDDLHGKSSFQRNKWTNKNSLGLGIAVFGDNNKIENCEISWSAGDGVSLYGSGNTLQNSSIHYANYLGTDAAPLSIGGSGNKVIQNEISHGGRGVVTMLSAQEFELKYNRIHHCGLLAWDVGLIYTYDTDAKGGVIAYNWISDANSGNSGTWGAEGVYLDNHSRNYEVHHNVIWNIKSDGIRFNDPSIGNTAYNNTIFSSGNMTTFNNGQFPGIESSGNAFFNNYLDVDEMEQTWLTSENNLGLDVNYLLHRNQMNFLPDSTIAENPLIDGGTTISGKPQHYSGKAPDIGAYEHRGVYWTAGRDGVMLEESLSNAAPEIEVSKQWIRDGNQLYLQTPVSYKILNVQGSVVSEGVGQKIDLSVIESGVYFVEISGRIHSIIKP